VKNFTDCFWSKPTRDHHTKREKSYANFENSKGQFSNGISGCVRKRGGSKRVPDYQLPEKRRSNEVLRRRLGSRRLRQGVNVRFFPFGVGRPYLGLVVDRR
jgi:hypothetical protein